MATLVTAVKIGSKFRGKILFDGVLIPVEWYRQDIDRDVVLADTIIGLGEAGQVVTWMEFQMELDHIRIFGCRWDPESIAHDIPDDDVISLTTAGMMQDNTIDDGSTAFCTE